MTAAVGSAEIDFGAWPGSNEASVTVTGQANIEAAASVESWFMADDTTASHTEADHRYAPCFISLTSGAATAGQGFTVYARSTEKMTGAFKVRWVWSN